MTGKPPRRPLSPEASAARRPPPYFAIEPATDPLMLPPAKARLARVARVPRRPVPQPNEPSKDTPMTMDAPPGTGDADAASDELLAAFRARGPGGLRLDEALDEAQRVAARHGIDPDRLMRVFAELHGDGFKITLDDRDDPRHGATA